jgi:Protein prenyltransferase alpha subunit repeat
MELSQEYSLQWYIPWEVYGPIPRLRPLLLRPACSSPKEINELLNEDLAMTTTALKVNPKVYWIWNHRRWCLEHIPENPDPADTQEWRRSTWERELFIVERMLEADSRNCPSVRSCQVFMHDSQLFCSFQLWHGTIAVMSSRACPFVVPKRRSSRIQRKRLRPTSRTLAPGTREPKC